MLCVDESGGLVRLGGQLTTPGGEGTIYELASDPTKVAKIYHQVADAQKVAKLRHLRTISSNGLLGISAWPVSLLFEAHSHQAVTGFLMPLVKGKEIHKLYGPHDRYSEFPAASWEFLVHVARNSAAAFETLHEHGVVMADVNEKNLLVTHQGLVRLIDCDSYQVRNASTIFHCDVGVPLWTPPELQGRDYRGLLRGKNHDRFGLAVLIFHLLFMGRHPFAGVPDRPEQFEIEKAIGRFLFAFTSKTRSLGIRPPPHALSVAALPKGVVELFERAFLQGSEREGSRPSGREWCLALDILEKNLRGCTRDPGHKYSAHLARCPWCEIYDGGGPNFFISVIAYVTPALMGGNVRAYWSAIQQAGLRPLLAKGRAEFPAPALIGTPLRKGVSKVRPAFYVGWLVLLGAVLLLFVVGWWAVLGILIGWGMISEGAVTKEFSSEAAKRRNALDQLRRGAQNSLDEAERLVEEYQRNFSKRKTELQAAYNRLLHLNEEEREEMRKLEANKQQLQLNEFLDRVLIRDHGIAGIKSRRKQLLAAYGIESALDISWSLRVPGFGRHLTSVLLGWRRQWEARFRYNPAAPLPQKAVQELALRMRNLRQTLEAELRGGVQSLNEIGVTAERRLRECEARTADLVRRQSQADADAAICS
jgi:DNA-binding helix-hairpin-helix protein with protein kinase domain